MNTNAAFSSSAPSILSLLTPPRIETDVAARNRSELFAEIGAMFVREGLVARPLIDALEAREKLGSTALGHGVAIPHGRIKNLAQARAAFLRTQSPIPFDAPDKKPVDLFFVLLVPENATEQHLQLLAELAQLVGDRALRDGLRAAADDAAVFALLRRYRQP
ncbi:MAG: PTS sugar transporter subunit IIA [Proteobacteria bacterium]|nr:PTS sugar transporter subunit IIA [Pseudomonadota bacterium]MCL2306824.1 PTS sugar transporter subunit IIA [Pseudomonadota bacterium]